MKKVYLFSAIAVMAAVTACTKEPVSNQPDPEEGPVPVQFGLASPAYSVTTKSAGGLDDWNNTTLYVFGYNRTAEDFTEVNALIYNVKATAVNETDVLEVKHDVSDDQSGTLEPFFYNGTTVYDFYGYHVDDAATQSPDTDPTPVVVTEDSQDVDGTTLTKGVYVKFTLNGAQDLLLAKAVPQADIDATSGAAAAGVTSDNAYSAFAARRGVHPTLNFTHQLARFKFQVRSGSESGNNVKVNSIKILNQQATGYLKVVGENPGITDAADVEDVSFELMQFNSGSGTMEPLGPVSFPEENKWSEEQPETTPIQVGESIMVMPGQASCNFEIATASSDFETPINPLEFTIKANQLVVSEGEAPDTFEAGNFYTITIVIYGPEDIEITAKLEDWNDGGNVEWDPDKPQAGTGE